MFESGGLSSFVFELWDFYGPKASGIRKLSWRGHEGRCGGRRPKRKPELPPREDLEIPQVAGPWKSIPIISGISDRIMGIGPPLVERKISTSGLLYYYMGMWDFLFYRLPPMQCLLR